MTTTAGAGHLGGSLSVADILVVLFFSTLRGDIQRPTLARDHFILSAGHLCPALYAIFAEAGYLPDRELGTFLEDGSRLQGHPSHTDLPLIESASGSLGQGLSVALGLALALKLDNLTDYKVFCVLSDAEHQEGSSWEAVMAAHHYSASNLIAIVDRNNLQISGTTENTMAIAPLRAKYEAFGWQVSEVDGHDFESLERALNIARNASRPAAIIAHTVMGKGVPSIENDYRWHGKPLPRRLLASALKGLEKNA